MAVFFFLRMCSRLGRSALLLAFPVLIALPLSAPAVGNDQVKSGVHGSGWNRPSEYPGLRTGVWERSFKRTLPSGKVESWISTGEFCHDTRLLFWSYLGRADVELGGCVFHSEKISTDKFKIDSRCSIEKHRIGTSESQVAVHGDSAYELDVDVKEGRRYYKIVATARRTADCPKPSNVVIRRSASWT